MCNVALNRMMARIYHITTEQEWQNANQQNQYKAESLKTEGFVHCSDANQVVRVANHFFKGVQELILLHIETEKLNARLVYENLEGGKELFPHVYGPIELTAIARVSPFKPDSDGSFDHHAGSFKVV